MLFYLLGFVVMLLMVVAERRQTVWLVIVREDFESLDSDLGDDVDRNDLDELFINQKIYRGAYIRVKVPKGRSVLVSDAHRSRVWLNCVADTFLEWPQPAKVFPLRQMVR